MLINPVGGNGSATKIFQQQISPLFRMCDIEMEVVVTKKQAHATEIAQQMPLETYDCLVSIGGDGLLSESECLCPPC